MLSTLLHALLHASPMLDFCIRIIITRNGEGHTPAYAAWRGAYVCIRLIGLSEGEKGPTPAAATAAAAYAVLDRRLLRML